MSQQTPKRILVIRLSAIGDILFASPLIDALRGTWPDAHIAWLAQPECRPLLANHPGLDEVIVWPRRDWPRLWTEHRWGELRRSVLGFQRSLRNGRFDLAVDLQGLLKSGLMAWFSGAPERIGLGSIEGSQWLMTRVIDRGGDPDRIGSEYLYLAQQLGLPTARFDMKVALAPDDEAFVANLARAHGLERGYAVICPFTTRPQKHWIEERWPALVARLRDELGLPVVMLGGPGDRAPAHRIAAATGRGLIDLAGATSLTQAAAVIGQAQLMVGVDTGLSHMGIAFDRPTVLLFGSTCPYLNTTRDSARVIYHRLECSPCRRNPTCNGEFACMRRITPDEIVRTARDLLEKRPGRG